jgi:hypothetical protein
MKRYGTHKRSLGVTTVIAAVAIVISGCGTGDGGESETEPDVDESAVAEGAAVNPCGPDGDGDVPGPPGEPPVDDAIPVTLTAVEYAFEDAESSYPAGDYAFTLANEGAELHEAILLRILDAEVSIDDLMAMSDEEAEAAIEFVGGAVACPDDTTEPFGAALESGRYVVACFLPVGSTADADLEQLDGPPHADEGMVLQITVDG